MQSVTDGMLISSSQEDLHKLSKYRKMYYRLYTEFNDKKFEEIYVFSFNIYSQGIIRVLNNKNYLIKGILDNNEKINIKKILKIKIFTPKKFFNNYQKKNPKIFVIICNQQKRDVKKIYKQLKYFGLKRKQISHVNFYNLQNNFLK